MLKLKTLLFALLVTLLNTISFSVLGQTAHSQKSEQEVLNMLCHKWQPISLKINGEIIPTEKADSALYIIFRKDGTFIDYFEGNSPSNKWTYNHKTMTITMVNQPGKIFLINDKELVLAYKKDGISSILTLRRLEN